MAILDRFVLPADAAIRPIADLDANLREQIHHQPGDYCVTRPHTRTVSSVVDHQTAALLECFRNPVTIVDAIVAYSKAEGLDPGEVLNQAFEVLGEFVGGGLLLPANSAMALPIASTLRPGDRVGKFEVIKPLHLVEDTEVYLARVGNDPAVALKIMRAAVGPHTQAAFAHEATILAHLDGRVSPRLFEVGEFEARPYLVIQWFHGIDVYHAADEARRLPRIEQRSELLSLAERVLGAYAHLHTQGVLHGDVHPRNLVVGADGEVTIVDFGMACMLGEANMLSPIGRGGIDLYHEPEVAAALLRGERAPGLSPAGEQYAVGALLFFLLTGTHTHYFSFERIEMLRQLIEQEPLTFHTVGIDDFPAVEPVISRALSKDPSVRYRTLEEFHAAFHQAVAGDCAQGGTVTAKTGQLDAARLLLDGILPKVAVPGQLFAEGLIAPNASAMNGAAGLSYALLRIARVRGDEVLLAFSDLWSTRSVQSIGSQEAFQSMELGISEEVTGPNSFYYHASGAHCVQALVAHARGDDQAQRLAVDAFIATCSEPCPRIDVAFGRSGLLLGCALLSDVLPEHFDALALQNLGDRLLDSVWGELEACPPLAQDSHLRALGAAHGWAGFLFAILRWCASNRKPLPSQFRDRLEQLAALGQPAG